MGPEEKHHPTPHSPTRSNLPQPRPPLPSVPKLPLSPSSTPYSQHTLHSSTSSFSHSPPLPGAPYASLFHIHPKPKLRPSDDMFAPTHQPLPHSAIPESPTLCTSSGPSVTSPCSIDSTMDSTMSISARLVSETTETRARFRHSPHSTCLFFWVGCGGRGGEIGRVYRVR